MKKISFDTKTGNILLDNIVIAPLGEIEFIEKSMKYKIEPITTQTNTHIHNFSTFGTLNEFEFGVNFIFENSFMKSIWLFWDGGNSKKYGYNTTENQLIADKNNLAKLLAKIFDKEPDEIKKTFSAFYFPWGNVSASASIQSSTTAIGISWNF